MIQDKEEGKEEKLTLKELIKLYGWVLDHPILRPIVEIAPSPKSADNYIVEQFYEYLYKNELAQAVRNAVRIRDKSKSKGEQTWKELLKTPEGSKLSDIFLFDEKSEYEGGYRKEQIYFSTGIKFLPNSKKAINCSIWPFILREFKMGNQISVDNSGIRTRFWNKPKLDEYYWSDNRKLAVKLDKDYKFEVHSKEQDDFQKIAWYNIFVKGICITGRIVKVSPQKGETYPRFYKTVSFCDREYGLERHSIDIAYPIDSFNRKNEGIVVFRKDIGLSGDKMCSSVNELIGTLELEFKMSNDFTLQPKGESGRQSRPVNYIQIRSIHGQPSLLFQGKVKPPAKDKYVRDAISVLHTNFMSAWQHCIKERINLLQIAGIEIINNPPKTLLDLFTA